MKRLLLAIALFAAAHLPAEAQTFFGDPLPIAHGGTGGTTATGSGSVVLQTAPTLSSPTVTGGLNGEMISSAGGLDLIGLTGAPSTLTQPYGAAALSNAVCTGSISGTVLTVTSCASGTIAVGQTLFDAPENISATSAAAPSIMSFGTGSGGAGTYNLSTSAGTIASETIYFGAGHNFAAGAFALRNCASCYNNIAIGFLTGSSIAADYGNILIGSLNGQAINGGVYNTVVGDDAAIVLTTGGSNSYFGRACGHTETTGDHNTGAGHGCLFTGLGNRFVTAIGDEAGGMPVAGGAIPSGNPFGGSLAWRNQGTNVFGFNGDINVWCIAGEDCGKATAAARFDAGCVGSYCRIPVKDHGIWLGNGYDYVGTSGAFWEGGGQGTVNSNTGVTLTCAQVLNGIIDRTGTPAGAVTDTTPTAAQIVSCVGPPGGPGNSAEVPIRHQLAIVNHFSANFTLTITAGAGVTITAPGGSTVGENFSAIWDLIVTNSTAGSEAVTFYRKL